MAMYEKKFVVAAKNSAAENGSRKTSETSQATWLGGSWKGSLWLCYAGSLSGRQKSGISDDRRRPKPTCWERNNWESWAKKKMGEEEPTTERRKKYTDLVERKEQCFKSHSRQNSKIACHASALALAITEEKCREAEM